jgi:dTDP-4-dehydrorhamnose 3,5-epimerase
MKFSRTELAGLIVCEPTVYGDERGYLVETFRQDKLEKFLGCKIDFVQDNESKSSFGVLRGLHYQLPPHSQAKLVRVIEGSVLDIAVDIRKNSPTFGKHVAIELTGANKKQLLVPRGFAHGFVVLSETATFAYKVDNFYNLESERGIAFDDEQLNIDWQLPLDQLKLSPKDMQNPSLKKATSFDFKKNTGV